VPGLTDKVEQMRRFEKDCKKTAEQAAAGTNFPDTPPF
jgi:hypothetical protein